MVYEVKFYVRIVFKAPNISRVNLTRGTPEGPKSEDNTRVNDNFLKKELSLNCITHYNVDVTVHTGCSYAQIFIFENVRIFNYISPVTAVSCSPLFLTFSNTEKRVNVYLVPAVRDETVWVTAPSPSGAIMFVSAPLNWRTKLTLLLTLFHCRVILVSSCLDDSKPSVFWGADTEKE